MSPDFRKNVVDTIAKRAAYRCSNPDCRNFTVGPNSNDEKSTTIGEAAHIFGARPKSKRYLSEMSDIARSDITNAIWLCRNCHKLIDTDEARYTSDVLFSWREIHERYILSELGDATDKIHFEEQQSQIEKFSEYPAIIRRILIDKPDGWEYRLTSELMRFLYKPYFRKLKDLRDGLYLKPNSHISEENAVDWLQQILSEQSRIVPPIERLLERLTESWGKPGLEGDLHEIHHITCLIRDYLEQIVDFEEQITFANVPEEYETIWELLKGNIGSQAQKLEDIPDYLDEVVSLIDTDHEGTIENPLVIEKTITFELPLDWSKRMDKEMKRIESKRSTGVDDKDSVGCFSIILVFFILGLIVEFF